MATPSSSSASSRPTQNRQWVLKKRPQEGAPLSTCFEQKSVSIPSTLTKGQVLVQVLYLSFDPTQSGWMTRDTYVPAVPLGEPMRSGGYGQVLESKSSSFQPGDIVSGLLNWQEYALVDTNVVAKEGEFNVPLQKIPGHFDIVQSLALGVTGLTAYFGMIEVGKMKKNDVVLVSGAAGATGSVAGQVARALGAKQVVGIAGGPAKCAWLTEKAHFDAAIDYKKDNVDEKLKQLCPSGVDVYFDNVGGPLLDTVLASHMAQNSRIVACGAISQYLKDEKDFYGVKYTFNLIVNRITMQGFIVLDYEKHFTQAMLTLNNWAAQGKICVQVDEQEGFENIPKTLDRLFTGANQGKQILKVSDPALRKRTSIIEKAAMKVMGSYFACKQSCDGSWTTPLFMTTALAAVALCSMTAIKQLKMSSS